jgi:EAL domain-containing protein (putative c-di-GMP-specific phosphodiesterase class I)
MEETGLIIDVGEWVIREACSFAVRHASINSSLRVAVNLSSIQLKQKDIVQKLEAILADTKCKPELLELEVTESSLVGDFEETRQVLEAISSMGITLAIDDFGTGYSSMNYLKRLPFNTLKIDRSFIIDAPTKTQDKAIVTTIAQLAHNLNMTIVAEGVETQEQYELVKSVTQTNTENHIQGFLFSRPVSEEELIHKQSSIREVWKNVESTKF